MKFLIALLLFPAIALAGEKELAVERAEMTKEGRALTAKEEDQLTTRGWRDRRADDARIPVSATVRPADYVNEVSRGTIDLMPGWKNYSYHTVRVPDGTVFDGNILGACNFTQIEPATDAFDRSPGFGHDLVFRHCNLINVKTYPDWTIESSNTAQIDRAGQIDAEGQVEITDSVVLGSNSSVVNPLRVKPAGVLTRPAAVLNGEAISE